MVIRESRIKLGLLALLFLWPDAFIFSYIRSAQKYPTLVFFGVLWNFLGALFIYKAIFPAALMLDDEGLALKMRSKDGGGKLLWRDIDTFYLSYGARGSKQIGFRLIAGREASGPLSGVLARGQLPGLWPGSTEDMIRKLNAYVRNHHPEGEASIAVAGPANG